MPTEGALLECDGRSSCPRFLLSMFSVHVCFVFLFFLVGVSLIFVFDFLGMQRRRRASLFAAFQQHVDTTLHRDIALESRQRDGLPLEKDGPCEQNTLSHCLYRREHCVHTAHCIDLFHAHAWPKLCVQNILSFFLLFRAISHDLHSTPSNFDLFFTVLYFSFTLPLRLKVDHVQNTLRRFTRPWR